MYYKLIQKQNMQIYNIIIGHITLHAHKYVRHSKTNGHFQVLWMIWNTGKELKNMVNTVLWRKSCVNNTILTFHKHRFPLKIHGLVTRITAGISSWGSRPFFWKQIYKSIIHMCHNVHNNRGGHSEDVHLKYTDW